MEQLNLYRYKYGENSYSFPVVQFDIAGAAGLYTIQTTEQSTPTGTTKVLKYIRIDYLAASAFDYMSGLVTDTGSPANLIRQPKLAGIGGVYTWDCGAVAQTVGQKPADWDSSWWWKYYTGVNATVDGTHYKWFIGLDSDSYDPTEQYYASEQITIPYFTGAGFFCVAPIVIGGTGCRYIGLHSNSSQVLGNTIGWAKWGGFGGEVLFSSSAFDGYSPYADGSLSTSGTQCLMQAVSFTYNGDEYTGILTVSLDSSGVPTGGQIGAIAGDFWEKITPSQKEWGKKSGVDTGGKGSFDNSSDSVGIPLLTDYAAISQPSFKHGMHIDVIGKSTVETIFDFLWGTSFWQRWEKSMFNPLAGIVSLHQLPVNVSSTGSRDLAISGVYISDPQNGSAVQVSPADARIHREQIGTIHIPEYYGSYLDYPPYTKCSIVLPFCGEYPLDLADCMGGSVYLVYDIDIATGDCVAFVECENRDGLVMLRKTYAGNCAWRIPVSGTDGGGTALLPMLSQLASGTVAFATGNFVGGALGVAGAIDTGFNRPYHTTAPQVQGNAACMGVLTPYLKIERAVQLLPENYGETIGHAAPIGGTVGETSDGFELAGFCKYTSVDLSGIEGADAAELDELRNLLLSGVWL